MPNYLTVAELDALKVHTPTGVTTVDLSVYSEQEKEDAIEEAEQLIEHITGDIFYSSSRTLLLDGKSKPRLWFPPVMPYACLSIDSVEEVDDDLTTVLDTYVENEDFRRYEHCLEILDSDQTARIRVTRGIFWPRGQKNIKIVGTFGAIEVPKAIKKAVGLLTLYNLAPQYTQLTKADVAQTVWDDFTITFRAADRSNPKVGQLTGLNEIDRLLSLYINYSSLFLVPDYNEKP